MSEHTPTSKSNGRFDARRATRQLLLLTSSVVGGLSAYWLTPKLVQASAAPPAQANVAAQTQEWDAATNAAPTQQTTPTWNEREWVGRDEWQSEGDWQGGQQYGNTQQDTQDYYGRQPQSAFAAQPQQSPRGWSRGS